MDRPESRYQRIDGAEYYWRCMNYWRQTTLVWWHDIVLHIADSAGGRPLNDDYCSLLYGAAELQLSHSECGDDDDYDDDVVEIRRRYNRWACTTVVSSRTAWQPRAQAATARTRTSSSATSSPLSLSCVSPAASSTSLGDLLTLAVSSALYTVRQKSHGCLILTDFIVSVPFLANVNSCSCSLYVVVRPSVVCRLSVCLSSVCNVRAPYSADWNFRQCFCAM